MLPRTLAFLRDLVSIDSVNPSLVAGGAGEQQLAEAIGRELHGAGLDVELQPVEPGRPNVVGILDGRRPGFTLVLCGHLDTVGVEGMSAPFDPVIREGRLYGRGAQDMKGGLAAIVGAVRTIAASGGLQAGRLIVAGVADEEDASRGAEAFARWWRGQVADSGDRGSAVGAVVTEPTDLAVGIAHKGFAWLRVTAAGRAAHGSRPREGRDAIVRMGRVLAGLDALERARSGHAGHPLLGPPSLHASFIEGGREWSTYPDRCELRLERRTLPGESPDEPLREVNRILESLIREDEEFSATAHLVFARRAYEIDGGHEFVGHVRAAARVTGGSDATCGVSFWADSAVLAEAGMASVLYGPGGAGLHGIEEYVQMEDVLACEATLVTLARTVCV